MGGFDKKDLETVTKVFNALSKAKWDSLDGNGIIEIHSAFVQLKKLEEKIKQGLENPAPAPSSVVKTGKKGKE